MEKYSEKEVFSMLLQIGIIYIYRKKFLDALYEYILASNSPDSFRGADLKVQQIFKMQASLNLG